LLVDALSGTAVLNGIPVTLTHIGGRLPTPRPDEASETRGHASAAEVEAAG
jgi:hypothetical protein